MLPVQSIVRRKRRSRLRLGTVPTVNPGFSQQYISDLERGRRNPTVVSLYELAQAMGVNYLEILQPNKQ